MKRLLISAVLLSAFYLSISYRYGDPGWRIHFQAREAAARGEQYDLGSLSILSRTVLHIKENYVDPDRINERKMIWAAMQEVQREIAELLVDVEKDKAQNPIRITVRVDKAEKTFNLSKIKNIWHLSFKFKDIFKFIQKNLKHHERLKDVEYAAINGMLSTLDPHSILLKPEEYREMKLSTRGKFGGLGIVISMREGHLTIVNPIEDTPASRAGLKAGDRIVQIELDSTVNMALNDAVDMLRGKPNTKVAIWISRKGWKKPRKFSLSRANIKVKSVRFKLLAGSIGVLRIRNFQNTTRDELERGIRELSKRSKGGKLRGLILDLRGNPGGLLDQAIRVSNLFIPSGPLVTTVGFGDKVREPKMATRSGTERLYPLAVLIDSSSASASEIVAGALKNHHRALIIGRKSFGKGSVQVIYDNKDDSALKLTIAQYLTPGDLSIQSVGITPDLEMRPVSIEEESTQLFPYKKRRAEKDLPEHLEHESAKRSVQEKPIHSLRYLRDPKLFRRIRENPNKIILDSELKLARSILAATRAGNREEMLEDAEKVIHKNSALEEERIISALKRRGIDWKDLKLETGLPKAEITLRTDRTANRVEAGETIILEAEIRNKGKAPFRRLWARTHSDNPLFDDLELLFGNIPPGERRSAKLPIKLPRSALSRRDLLRLEFKEALDHAPEERKIKVEVQQLPRPRFALRYRIDDRQRGNGDGLLQHGEDVDLLVWTENRGQGPSYGLLVSVRNDDRDAQRGIFIKRGRIKAEGLKVGEGSEQRFKIQVKGGGAAPQAPVSLLIRAVAPEIGEWSQRKILLPTVSPQEKLKPVSLILSPKLGDQIALRALKGLDQAIAQAPRLWADARLGAWLRVPAQDQLFAWVPSAEVIVDSGEEMPNRLQMRPPSAPPEIRFDESNISVEMRQKSLRLKGKVSSDRPVKDLLIFLNDRKVFFKSAGSVSGDRDLPFSAKLKLDKGINHLSLVAREEDDLSSRRDLIIHRLK